MRLLSSAMIMILAWALPSAALPFWFEYDDEQYLLGCPCWANPYTYDGLCEIQLLKDLDGLGMGADDSLVACWDFDAYHPGMFTSPMLWITPTPGHRGYDEYYILIERDGCCTRTDYLSWVILTPGPTEVLIAHDFFVCARDSCVALATPDVPLPPVAEGFAIGPAFPNPFNASTTIEFHLPTTAAARMDVFDVVGRHVITLIDEVRTAGSHRVIWTGQTADGLTAASGVYLCRLSTPQTTAATKLLLVR